MKLFDNIFDLSYPLLSQVWKTAILDYEKAFLFHIRIVKALTNRYRYLNTFRLLCFMLIYNKALEQFCYSFNLQSSLFL